MSIWSGGRAEWVRRMTVPSPSGTSSIATVVVPGGTGGPCSHPHVNTTRLFSTTSTTRPEANPPPVMFTLQTPPATRSISASVPCQASHFSGSVK